MNNCKCCDEQDFNQCTCDHEPKYAKPGKPKKRSKKTTGDKSYLNWVASQGCVICGGVACVHHIRISGEPRDHKKTIPLCYNHHQGAEGIHTLGKYAWRKKYGHELEHLKKLESRFV